MRVAYADPPYPGQARKHYGLEVHEVNHDLLLPHLMEFDAWALSTSSVALPTILPLCPGGVRIGAWVKSFAVFKPGINPAYAWEPVIFYGGRKRRKEEITRRDWIESPVTLQKGTVGAKPIRFCWWVFDFLNLLPTDEFHDLFPGSGAVTESWDHWCKQTRLFDGEEPDGS